MAPIQIDELEIDEHIEEKLVVKHRVSYDEAWEACQDAFRTARRGRAGTILVYGRTEAGRPLLVVLVQVERRTYKVVTAREVTDAERRTYLR